MMLDRRTVLTGLGVSITLPWLETLAKAAGTTAAAPKRLRAAFLYVPNGVHIPDWMPTVEGKLTKLPPLLKALEPHRDSINLFGNLTLDKARANGDGPGDHARAQAAFLTGRQPRKTNGANIRVGKSADQYLAENIGKQTKFASLEIGIEPGRQSGNCDSGYSCAYQSNFSWRNDSTPNAKEIDPKLVFERLFGSGTANEKSISQAKRDQLNKSILDFVNEEAKSISRQVSSADQRKLDEYLVAIRELEMRINKQEPTEKVERPKINIPARVPRDVREHLKIMSDLMILAFQADLTRVVTFPFANDGSNRNYEFIGVPDGHHNLSHHGRDPKKIEKIARINAFHVQQLGYILTRLSEIKEGDSSLLDQSMIVYGSGIGDGNRHNHDDLPILLAGKGGGSISGGRFIKTKKETPLMNLYMAMFDRFGCPAPSFGDSTGTLII
ncbi:MAG: DUF1552 domain-containing protein [Zavarzinella sp.]